MNEDETPKQNHRSGEQPATYADLMVEIRALRKESNAQNVAIAAKVDDVRGALARGELRFEQHHARLNAIEKWQNDHGEAHRELVAERRRIDEQAKAEAKENAKAGPHWAVQAMVSTIITVLTTSLIGGVIYLITMAPKVSP